MLQAIKLEYNPNQIIIGSQKITTNINMKGARGVGTRHVVYWIHPYESGAQPLKGRHVMQSGICDVLTSRIWFLCKPA